MEYSASLVSKPFWYSETKLTAGYLAEGDTKESLKKRVIEENLYRAQTEYRAIEMLDTITRRLGYLPQSLVQEIADGDVALSKVLVLIALMRSDKLFFEFVYEVVQEKILIGENCLTNVDLDTFFEYKATQSEKVAGWSAKTVSNLKHAYVRMLFEANILQTNKNPRPISVPILDSRIEDVLRENQMNMYLAAITGGL